MKSSRAFRELGTIDLVAYLRSRGWSQQVVSPSEPMLAWTLDANGESWELLVPRHKDWRDYDRRIAEVLSTLAEVEERPPELIAKDIAAVAVDTLRIRASTDRNSSSIPLEDGRLLLSAARGSLLAAASATVEKRRAYHTRKPTRAMEYLEGVRLGQSEVGSYVMTLLSPVPPSLSAQLSFVDEAPDPDPYERQVTLTLAKALDAMRSAAETSAAAASLDAFEKSVPLGVNADLCEAIAAIAEAKQVVSASFEVGYAPSRPPPTNILLPRATLFTRDIVAVVAEAGRLLRERTPDEDFILVGPVIEVQRPSESESLFGSAVVFGVVDREPRKVRVELWGPDWELAHGALKEPRKLLRCVGELQKAGRGFALRKPRAVEVLDADEVS